MCGIYGEFFPNGNLTQEQKFRKSNDLNFQRGPDMMGRWSDENLVQLGFRRKNPVIRWIERDFNFIVKI